MSTKPKYMEMGLPVGNTSFQKCDRFCCSWGQRKSTYDKEGNLKGIIKSMIFIGGITPLWENPSLLFYKILFILTLIGSLLFIGSYVAIQNYNSKLLNSVPAATTDAQEKINQANNKDCVEKSYSYLKSFFIIIGSAILLINCKINILRILAFYYLFLNCVGYASDKEWSKYLIIHALLWVALVGFLFIHFLTVINLIFKKKVTQNIGFYNNDKLGIFKKTGTESCKSIFMANILLNLVVAVLVSILAILQIIKIIHLWKKFFFTKYVPHSAMCTDDDIIVLY